MIAENIQSSRYRSKVSKMVILKVLLLLLASHAVLSTNNGTRKTVTETQETNNGENIKDLSVPVAFGNKNLTKQVSSVKLHLSKKVTAKIKLNKLSKSKDSIELAKERFRKTTKTTSLTYSKCKHIKCTAEEKPVCAKMIYKNNKTNVMKPLYIIMINICEIKYAECHKGMEASVVPMKNCHPKLRKSLLATGQSRSKREVENDHATRNKTTQRSKITFSYKKNLPSNAKRKLRNKINIKPVNKKRMLSSLKNTKISQKSRDEPDSVLSKEKILKSINNTHLNKTDLKYPNKSNVTYFTKPDIKSVEIVNRLKSPNKTTLNSYNNSNHKSIYKKDVNSLNKSILKLNNNTSAKSIRENDKKPSNKVNSSKVYLKSTNNKPFRLNTLKTHSKPILKSKSNVRLKNINTNSKNQKITMNKVKRIARDGDENVQMLTGDNIPSDSSVQPTNENQSDILEITVEISDLDNPGDIDVGEGSTETPDDEAPQVVGQVSTVGKTTGASIQGYINIPDINNSSDNVSLEGSIEIPDIFDPSGLTKSLTATPHIKDSVGISDTDNPNATVHDEEPQLEGTIEIDTDYSDFDKNAIYNEESEGGVGKSNYQKNNGETYNGNEENVVSNNDEIAEPGNDNTHDEEFNDAGGGNGSGKVDEVEYQANCPRVCPTRDVMVCAMCQHSIYKTFPSICHMRMFECYHKDEALELVSRYPCVMSAPFLSENPPMDPKGRVSEPDDTDIVLRFLRCREKGKLGNGPKCTFEKSVKFNDEVPDTNENTDEY